MKTFKVYIVTTVASMVYIAALETAAMAPIMLAEHYDEVKEWYKTRKEVHYQKMLERAGRKLAEIQAEKESTESVEN